VLALAYGRGPSTTPYLNEVITWRVSATGQLGPAIVSNLSTSSNSASPWVNIAAGTLNADTLPDLVASEGGQPGGTGAFSVLLNNGAGGFTVGARYTTAGALTGIALCDIDGNGRLDAVVNVSGTAGIFPGSGTGTFGIPFTVLMNQVTGTTILCGDVNGDAKPDLLNVTNNGLLVALGNGNFTFQTATIAASGAGANTAPVLVDINADGVLDVVADTGQLYAWLGDGAGHFGAPHVTGYLPPYASSGLNNGRTVAIADVDGDGAVDAIVTSSAGAISVMFGANDGTFSYPVGFPTGGTITTLNVAAADFNGDGRADVATVVGVNGSAASLDLMITTPLNSCY